MDIEPNNCQSFSNIKWIDAYGDLASSDTYGKNVRWVINLCKHSINYLVAPQKGTLPYFIKTNRLN